MEGESEVSVTPGPGRLGALCGAGARGPRGAQGQPPPPPWTCHPATRAGPVRLVHIPSNFSKHCMATPEHANLVMHGNTAQK